MKTTQEVIRAARKHIGGEMESSARLCLADAIALADRGDLEAARARAVRSLTYSVGQAAAEKIVGEHPMTSATSRMFRGNVLR